MLATFLRSELLAGNGVVHGFSLRGGGVSQPPLDSLNVARNVGDDDDDVEENRRRLARAIGFDPESLFEVDQVHGAEAVLVDGSQDPEAFRGTRADALVAMPNSGATLGIRTADCVPVLIAHPSTGTVAAVHVGWRGAVAGVLGGAVDLLLEVASESDPSTLCVALGPHIHVDAFEVGEDVADALATAAPGSVVIRRGDRRPHADLGGVCRAQLHAKGVPDEVVDQVGECTYRHPAQYFSHRRDGDAAGRHLSVVVAGPPLPTAA